MGITKQVGTISNTRLSNAAHMNLYTEINDRINKATATTLKLETLAPVLKACLDKEGACVNRITKSITTDLLFAKDGERDKVFQFISSMNAAYLVCPTAEMQAAAKILDAVLRAYDRAYNLPFSEETAALDGLLRDMTDTTRAAAAKTLKLDPYFAQLETLNNEYKELDASRTDEYTARVKTDTSQARKATEKAFEQIAQRINALAVLEPTDEILAFIDTVNQIFRKYKDLIAAKGNSSSPSKPDKEPDPEPTPEPTPDPEPDPEPDPDPDPEKPDRPVEI